MSQPANSRQTLINLGITLGVVVLVLIAAIVFRSEPPATVPRTGVTLPSAPADATKTPPPAGETLRGPTDRFEQFANARLVEATTNEADTLRINTGDGDHIFSLYFIDALDTDFSRTKKLQEQASFFGNTTPEAVVETGRDAMRTVANILATRPFRLLTRWERLPETAQYLALILVQKEDGQWTYLADMLVRQGFARISGITTPLPDDARAMEDYLIELRNHAKYAQDRHLGIWARSPATR